MLADQRGNLMAMATTGEQAQIVELFEIQHDEGPILDSFRTGEAITNVDPVEAAKRWPRFTRPPARPGSPPAMPCPCGCAETSSEP